MATQRAARTVGRLPRWARAALAGLFWLAAWQALAAGAGSPLLLAGPVDTALALARLVPTAAFWGQVGFSTVRIVSGAALAYAAAFALAAASSRSAVVRALLHPALAAIKGTPVACVAVMLLIWFGSRNVALAAVFLMALPGVYFAVLAGLGELDRGGRELFGVFGVGRPRRLGCLVWPGLLPYVLAASETVLGMSWKAGVAAELIGTPLGSIGEQVYQSKITLATDELFAWTAIVVLISWVFERAACEALRASWPAAGRIACKRGVPAATQPAGRVAADGLAIGRDGAALTAPISFELGSGGALAVLGASGAGKTTLLRTIAGLEHAVAGSRSITGAAARGKGPRISFVFQDTRLVEDLTAAENVLLFAGSGLDAAGAEDLLAELLPRGAVCAPVRELSGGQRRRVELARALAAPTALVLLDEPFTGLDATARERALAFIQRHLAARPLIIATHDERDASDLGARVLRIG